MALRVPDSWVWDLWLADDGQDYHLFFLRAPKYLGDPDARHAHASVGHGVSSDLVHWHLVEDALGHGPTGHFDSSATWTGSVALRGDGVWFMFYTGVVEADDGFRQSIGLAMSTDLATWTKSPDNPVLEPDGFLYETFASSGRAHAFRDPWVYPDPAGHGWHMLITARTPGGPADSGVVGHAWSPDLLSWQLRSPLSQPGQGFPVLEVLQMVVVAGQPTLLFSCPPVETSPPAIVAHPRGGIWVVAADSTLGPFSIDRARQIVDDGRYSGRAVYSRRNGHWVFLAFDNDPTSPTFCQIGDPVPLHWTHGHLGVNHGHRSTSS